VRLRRRRHGFHNPRLPRRGRFKAGRLRADRRRHPWLRRVLLASLALVLLVVVAGAAGWFYLRDRIGQVPKVTLASGALTPQRGGAPYDVLLVESPGGEAPADLVVVARVVPADRAVELLAIPPLLRLPAPGARRGAPPAELFGSLAPDSAGGLSILVHNVSTGLHIPVSHLAVVDTAGLRSVVDRLGGVYLDFPAPLADQSTGLRLDAAGCQRVGGSEAGTLAASTSPYWYQGGQWQQWTGGNLAAPVEMAVLAGLLLRASPSLGNLLGMNDLVEAAGGHVRLDSTWGVGALTGDAAQLAGISPAAIGAETLPTAPDHTPDAATRAVVAKFLLTKPTRGAAAAPWVPRACTP
jgi:hypothetical protein